MQKNWFESLADRITDKYFTVFVFILAQTVHFNVL